VAVEWKLINGRVIVFILDGVIVFILDGVIVFILDCLMWILEYLPTYNTNVLCILILDH